MFGPVNQVMRLGPPRLPIPSFVAPTVTALVVAEDGAIRSDIEGALAAAFFMLGETKGTSAGGAAEAGKSLRVPGTNPFFPLLHAYQGNRFLELIEANPMDVYLLNTGRIGGNDKDERSKKVKIQHSSAVVKAIAEGTIKWERDPDFGYLVATEVPGMDDPEMLQPRKMYERQGRIDEYNELVKKYVTDRR